MNQSKWYTMIEMLKYQAERNWANNVHELRSKYSLTLSDKNVCNDNI